MAFVVNIRGDECLTIKKCEFCLKNSACEYTVSYVFSGCHSSQLQNKGVRLSHFGQQFCAFADDGEGEEYPDMAYTGEGEILIKC